LFAGFFCRQLMALCLGIEFIRQKVSEAGVENCNWWFWDNRIAAWLIEPWSRPEKTVGLVEREKNNDTVKTIALINANCLEGVVK